MDPHSFIARAEAQRWLGIAEKLLMSNDLVGSKTFAIRARESDPRLEAADQILAIADTLLAAEKRVVGNNATQQPDYYAILQLVRFVQETDHIASQYRRLAVLLNPHQNRFPYSDQAFQLVNDAWTVLSNPIRKSMYDAELDLAPQQQQMDNLGFNLEQQHHQQQHHHHQQHQHQHNFFSINHMGTGHDPELPESQQSFQTRVQRGHQQQQLQQHNFLSQNPVRPVPVREQEQLFQHRDQEQLFQQHVQPFQVTSAPPQQTRPPPQPPQPHPPMQPPAPPPPAAPPQNPFSWPQAPPLSQPQLQQQQRLQEVRQQQQQSLQQNASFVQLPNQVNSDNGVRAEEEEDEIEAETETAGENVDESSTFWTACPYCLYMYEYPRVFVDLTLRCDNCKRAFQAVPVSSPPSPIMQGQDAYYYCWGFYPLGVSMSQLQKKNGTCTNSKWTPFSNLNDVSSNVQDHLNERAASKKNSFRNSGPRIYIDDETDDIFMGISEPSDDSDLEWGSTKKKKAKRMKKGFKPHYIKKAQVVAVRVTDARNGSKNVRDGTLGQDCLKVPSLPVAETSKKALGVNTRSQSGRIAKELGKLDLNVEFNNNEGEEPAARMASGNRGNGQGDGDNIEGIGFFEGLDEFFSSLPILSAVNDEKVKAA